MREPTYFLERINTVSCSTNLFCRGAQTITQANLPDSCGNWCHTVGTVGSILDEFPCGVTTIAQAMEMVAQEVSKRLGGAKLEIVALTTTSWQWSFQLGLQACNLGKVVVTTAGNGSYPITANWERADRGSSGVNTFHTLDSFISFLVSKFKS